MLNPDLYREFIGQIARHACCLILYFQGEPFIHPRFFEFVREARRAKLYTITSTNGHFLDNARARETVESGLSRLIISIDGTTQESYSRYRIGGSLSAVQAGVKRLVSWKRKLGLNHPLVVVQFLVLRSNEEQIEEMRSWARDAGVDELQLKTAQLYDFQNGHDLMPETERYSRYQRQADGGYKLRHKLLNHCWRLWHTSVITWDGRVLPCCFDKDAQHQLGSLLTHSFEQVWKNPVSMKFRQHILQGRDQIDICTNCTEGCKVRG